ncbi:MAG: potassium-transporting ATPase subunit KdpC [Chloroflexi bacterium]|nr:potassium-transporting ATPase subunit KdpC [Chloroflexota bacterium]
MRTLILAQLRPAIVLLAAFTLLTGVIYPAAVTGIAQLLFPHQANGSVIYDGEQAVGSELIGQSFSDPAYFWPRPSLTPSHPYNGAASAGNNNGPLQPALQEQAQARLDELAAVGQTVRPVPVDLVTASGSGLDPHISPAAAHYQLARVAQARQLPLAEVAELVAEHTSGRALGLFGEPRVNVLQLNLALDALSNNP